MPQPTRETNVAQAFGCVPHDTPTGRPMPSSQIATTTKNQHRLIREGDVIDVLCGFAYNLHLIPAGDLFCDDLAIRYFLTRRTNFGD